MTEQSNLNNHMNLSRTPQIDPSLARAGVLGAQINLLESGYPKLDSDPDFAALLIASYHDRIQV